MGWMASYNWTNKQELVEHLLNPHEYSEGTKILAHSVVGNNLWMVIEVASGERELLVCKMSGAFEEGWGYKMIGESAGPVEVNCPLYLIDLAGEPLNDWAREWREKVRKHHDRKRIKKAFKIKPGMRFVSSNGVLYSTQYEYNRMCWVVQDANGGRWSMQKGRIIDHILNNQEAN